MRQKALLLMILTISLIVPSCSVHHPFSKEVYVPDKVAVRLARSMWLPVVYRDAETGDVKEGWALFSAGDLIGHK